MDLSIKESLLVTKEGKIDINKLNENQYIITLLQEGLKSGGMSAVEVFHIQNKIMELLKELIMKYTKGESTSVTVEVTESLLNSLLYSIDFYLLKLDNPEKAIMDLKNNEIKKIYDEGLHLLRQCVIDTKKLYERIKRDKLRVELEAYNASLDEAIPIFFEKYSIVFEAHNTMASIDYPLIFDDMRVRGISYIKNYLEHLEIETEFCRLFLEDDISKIITGFGRMCRLNSQIELINIFELLINNSIFSTLCGNNARQLKISKDKYKMLSEKLRLTACSNIIIDNAMKKVLLDLKISNPLLIEYMENYKALLLKRILNAMENNCLNSLMVIEEENTQEFSYAFNKGKRMSEKNFNIIVGKIINLTELEGKIGIINSCVDSLQDFIDILNADCFFREEFYAVFNTLGSIELAILAKLVFYEELRDGLTDLSEIIISKKEAEFEWQEYFIKFIDKLSKDKKEDIEGLLDQIDYEEINFY